MNYRKHIIAASILAVVSILVSGCATNGVKPTPAQIAADACTVSHIAVPTAITLAYQFGVKNPAQQAQVNADIYQVSANLNALLTGGTVTPAQLTAALKVKEPYVQTIISTAAGALGPLLTQLNASGTNGPALMLQVVGCIAADAAAATHP